MQLVFTFLQWHFESRQTDQSGNILFSSLHFLLSPHLSSSNNNSGQRQEWSSCVARQIYLLFSLFFSNFDTNKVTSLDQTCSLYLLVMKWVLQEHHHQIREWCCLPPALVTTQTVTNNDHVSTNMLIVSRGGKYWSKSTSLLYVSRLFRYFRSFSVLECFFFWQLYTFTPYIFTKVFVLNRPCIWNTCLLLLCLKVFKINKFRIFLF